MIFFHETHNSSYCLYYVSWIPYYTLGGNGGGGGRRPERWTDRLTDRWTEGDIEMARVIHCDTDQRYIVVVLIGNRVLWLTRRTRNTVESFRL